jgi:serine/threonine protein kinase
MLTGWLYRQISPDVVGTPDFIAPEVVTTSHLPKDDPKRVLPSIATDRHALSVLIYMYLLFRHPLRGGKIHDMDDEVRMKPLLWGKRLCSSNITQTTATRLKSARSPHFLSLGRSSENPIHRPGTLFNTAIRPGIY